MSTRGAKALEGNTSVPPPHPHVLLVESVGNCHGGAEMMLDELLHRADRSRFSISFACLAEGSWPDAVRAEGIPVYVVPQTRWRDVRNMWSVSTRLKEIIRSGGVDCVHASGSNTLLCASLAARRAKVPLVWMIFDPLRGSSPRRFLTAQRKVSAWLLERFNPDWVIFGTARVAEGGPIRRGTPTSTILPGIALDRYRGGDGQRARRELGISPEAPMVVTLGRLTYLKSQLGFLRIMGRVIGTHPDVRGVICGGEGDVGYARRVRALRSELGLDESVTITGFVPDQLKDDIVAAADLVVHLAKRESFGLAVVEGMAAGKVVIAADASGPRSLIDDGRTGVLVPVDDEDATVAAIERLLDDPSARAALASAAVEAAGEHPVEKMVLDIEDVWDAVLEKADPTRN
jgi:glycosyltransferase involved in cell wall biosynthesis